MSETLALIKEALAKSGDPAELAKATFNQPGSATVGLQPYDLEPAAKNLYPVLTPLRNSIPRVSGKGGIQANWKGVTAIDTGSVFAGISEGHRGSVISVQTKEYFAAYRTLGMEAAVTDEAELAAGDFDDVRARAANSLLQSCMIAEEKIILGGNTSFLLGTTPTPTLTTATTGGSIAATQTVSVVAVALTYEGKLRWTVAGGLTPLVTRTTADGFTESFGGGVAQKSASATIATGGTATNTVTASVVPVPGAYGYAWYVGLVGSERLAAITNFAAATFTTLPGSGQLLSAVATALGSDNSTNSLVHDGLLTMVGSSFVAAGSANNGQGSYYVAATQGSGLTADGVGGIVEFDTALQYYWDVLRLSPSRIVISSQEMTWIRKKILAGGSGANQSSRFVFNIEQGQITGGGMPKGYLNPFAMSGGPAEIPFVLHPNMPAGTVLFLTDSLPYPMNNISNVMQIRARRDYYQIEWPRKTRAYEYGVYSDQVLQHYFMPGMGVITGLAAA